MDNSVLPHELFLLMLNLSRIQDEEMIIKYFLEALNSRLEGIQLRRRFSNDSASDYILDASTINGTYARLILEGNTQNIDPKMLSFLRNGAAMLAIILENRRQSKLLEIAAARAISERDRLFQMSVDLLCVASLEGYFIDLNPAWEDVLGWTVAELKAKPFYEFTHPDDRFNTGTAIATLKEGRTLLSFENRYICRNGKYRTLSWNSFPVVEEGLIYAVARDVTDQKIMELALRQAEKMQAIGQLAGGVAHDFNNQLSGIMGYAELILSQVDDPKLKHYAAGILKASGNAAQLISQLMAFSRKQEFERIPVDIDTVIRDVMELLSHSIDKRITLKHEFCNKAFVRGDAVKLQNALLNLGINAKDAMPGGGVITFTTKLVMAADEPSPVPGQKAGSGAYIRILVSDTGEGMNEVTATRIFEPFFTTKDPGMGTGMGLAVTLGTIEAHEGKIEVETTPGKGTTFIITLPALPENIIPDEMTGGIEGMRLPLVKLLVIDDEVVVLEMITAMLTNIGCSVIACNNAGDALARYRENHVSLDLVILDMVMPVMSGKEIYRELMAVDDTIKVLLISGHANLNDVGEILSRGNSHFLAKPYKMRELIHAISILLERNIFEDKFEEKKLI